MNLRFILLNAILNTICHPVAPKEKKKNIVKGKHTYNTTLLTLLCSNKQNGWVNFERFSVLKTKWYARGQGKDKILFGLLQNTFYNCHSNIHIALNLYVGTIIQYPYSP